VQKFPRIGMSVVFFAILLAVSQVSVASAAAVRFGAKLGPDVQPQPALWCDHPNDTPPHSDCTWLMKEAYGRAQKGHVAPKSGTIGRVRLMSCNAGSLKIQVARKAAGSNKYRVVKNGPKISYKGDPQGCGDDDDFVYKVESFVTGFTVQKGDRIAIKAKKTGTLRCGSGGPNTLQFSPPLVAGGRARKASDDEGCFLLMEWQYR
jgi:hypothetical protein